MNRNISYRPDIDGLRALAVLAVVVYHAFPEILPAGFIGVDIFFVISGFLISKILLREIESGELSLWSFYERRIKRLLPALLLVLIVIMIAGWFVLLPDEYRALGRHVVGGGLFFINFMLAGEHGYFDSAAEEKPLLHLWSLAVEEQFYLAWPLLFLVVFHLSMRLWMAVLVVGIASLVMAVVMSHSSPEYSFFTPFSRAWEFSFGCAVALLEKNVRNRFATTLSCVGMLLLMAAFCFVAGDLEFVSLWMIMPVLGSALIILSGSAAWINKNILSQRAFVVIGLISYPLYLWHWPVFSLLNITEGGRQPVSLKIGAIALSMFLAWATWFFVERFVREKWGRLMLLSLFGIWGGLLSAALFVIQYDGAPERMEEHVRIDSGELMWPMSLRASGACQESYNIHGLSFCLNNIPVNPSVAIVGDSFSNQFYYGLGQLYAAQGVGVINLGRHSCAPIYGIQAFRPDKGCATVEHVLDELKKNNDIETVVLAASWSGTKSYLNEQSFKPFSKALERTIADLQMSGKTVFLLGSTPLHALKPSLCAMRPFRFFDYSRDYCSVPQSLVDIRLERERRLLREVSSEFSDVMVIDPVVYLCNGGQCSLRLNGKLLYRDGHISKYGSVFLAEKLLPILIGDSRDNNE